MNITVIIPTHNAAQYLPKLLSSIRKQTIHTELIIVDSSSSDKSVEIASSFADRIVVISKDEFDHGGTRTKMSKLANGDIVVFLTQDALPFDEDCIKKLVKPFEDAKVAVAYGRQIAYDNTGPFGTFLRKFNYPEYSNERVYEDKKNYGLRAAFVSNSFCAYRKSSLEKIGYFEDKLILSEDMYAAANLLRDGHKIFYTADAKVYHSHDYSLVEEFKRYFDIGVFHGCKPELQKEFGSAAGEGKRFVKEEFQYLISIYKYYLVPLSIVRNGLKLLAYKLGKNYTKIPKKIIPFISMHKGWWDKA